MESLNEPTIADKDVGSGIDDFFCLNNLEIPKTPSLGSSREDENVVLGTEESNTDSLVDYILRKLGIDEDSFLLRVQSR